MPMCAMINRKEDFTPFDMKRPPCKQNLFLLPVIWGASFLITRRFKLKIDRFGIKGLKPPYLLICAHQGFADYYITPLATFPHRTNYVSDMEGYAAFGEGLYRAIGCIGKRRFVTDMTVLKNIRHALKKGQIVALYPESRHSNAGTTSLIPDNIGRLCKTLGVPVATLTIHGSYLANPFWDEEHTRRSRITAKIELQYSAEELKSTPAEEIQTRIESLLTYDEYRYQLEERIPITYDKRAEGLHLALYRCPKCKNNYKMRSEGARLFCTECNAEWTMNQYGVLEGEPDYHIPDWYESQRNEVTERIEHGEYHKEFHVCVEALPNSKGFIPIGEGRLTHDKDGFTLFLSDKERHFSTVSMESVQTEYNYRGRGTCLVLSDKDCCYYVYCTAEEFNVTEIQFAAEYYHKQTRSS